MLIGEGRGVSNGGDKAQVVQWKTILALLPLFSVLRQTQFFNRTQPSAMLLQDEIKAIITLISWERIIPTAFVTE
jgi:hypothetical protein